MVESIITLTLKHSHIYTHTERQKTTLDFNKPISLRPGASTSLLPQKAALH